jgi:hypothetical protein
MYVAMNPSKQLEGKRVSGRDITHWSTICIDIDPIEAASDPSLAAWSVTAHLREILGEAVAPTVIDSGRGMQLWLRLQPLELNPDLRWRVRSAVGSLLWMLKEATPVHGCVVDTSTSDLARVARMPETVNSKTRRRSEILERGQLLGEAGVHSILALAQPFGPPPAAFISGSFEEGGWKRAAHHMSELSKDFLEFGVPEPGRHKAAYAAAAALRDIGLSIDTAEPLVLAGARRCAPSLSDYDAVRAARCAYDARELT